MKASSRGLSLLYWVIGSVTGLFGDPQAVLARPASYACSVMDTSGHAETIRISWDAAHARSRIGMATAARSQLPLPRTATLSQEKGGIFEFRSTIGESEYVLKLSDTESPHVQIEFFPFRNASAHSGFVGFCRPSPTPPIALLPSAPLSNRSDDDAGHQWSQFSRDITLRCSVLSQDGTVQTAVLGIIPDVDQTQGGQLSLTVGKTISAGHYISAVTIREGDHDLVLTMFSLSGHAQQFVGALRMRGPVFWLYALNGNSSHYKAFCSE